MYPNNNSTSIAVVLLHTRIMTERTNFQPGKTPFVFIEDWLVDWKFLLNFIPFKLFKQFKRFVYINTLLSVKSLSGEASLVPTKTTLNLEKKLFHTIYKN